MLELLIVILVLLWAAGYLVIHVGSVIHLLLVVAVIVFIYRVLVKGEPQ